MAGFRGKGDLLTQEEFTDGRRRTRQAAQQG